jgi:hypothetical protein
MSFPVLVSRDLFGSHTHPQPIQPQTASNAIIVAPPSQVVPYSAPEPSVPSTPSPLSPPSPPIIQYGLVSTIASLPIIPRAVYVGLSIAGIVGAISLVSWRYCPWWYQRRWQRVKNPKPIRSEGDVAK